MLQWDVDSDYTQTGSNSNILVQNETIREEFNTLRFFPNSTQDNCYIVPAETQIIRYILRAGFYYGNYDGLSSPPTFNLFINDVKWATVNTSKNNGEPYYEEINYENNGSGFFKICLVQIKDGGLKIIYFRFDPLKFDEMYNRVWSKGVTPSNCDNFIGYTDVTATIENYPPYLVLMDSVQPTDTDTIILTVDLPQSAPQTAYFVFYVTELKEKSSIERRAMKLEIAGKYQGTVEAPSKGETAVITKYPVTVSGPTINIRLTRDKNSTLPPMIAGMEVFTKWDTGANHTDHSAAAAGVYITSAISLMIPFVFLLVA
ncbi:hypothetical protein DCAR_0415546 [Daucus carota subsp. sativus]|uniref:Malectin-like domain-containing protein n=1 Tax=Daucus carota subsp. sativus TaxID=79200 RepID=A0AAF0WXB9_DAUCS|nr:hypothetical protein DCAR_0415546 [Daucus carota subsp. sativus]